MEMIRHQHKFMKQVFFLSAVTKQNFDKGDRPSGRSEKCSAFEMKKR